MKQLKYGKKTQEKTKINNTPKMDGVWTNIVFPASRTRYDYKVDTKIPNINMEIEGYIVVASYNGENRFLSGNRWIKDVRKLKLSDITSAPRHVNENLFSKIDSTPYNAQINISIQI